MSATMQLVPVPIACPKCGGKLWDNRESKKNPKQPDFKCRDKACDGLFWPLREGKVWVDVVPAPAPRPVQQVQQSYGVLPGEGEEAKELHAKINADPFDAIFTRHARCLEHVVENEVPYLKTKGIVADAEAVSALVAQLFIESSRRAA